MGEGKKELLGGGVLSGKHVINMPSCHSPLLLHADRGSWRDALQADEFEGQRLLSDKKTTVSLIDCGAELILTGAVHFRVNLKGIM